MILGHVPNGQDMSQTCIYLVYVKTVDTYRNTIGICVRFGTYPKFGKYLGHEENVGTCSPLWDLLKEFGTLCVTLVHVCMRLGHVERILVHMSQFEKICRVGMVL